MEMQVVGGQGGAQGALLPSSCSKHPRVLTVKGNMCSAGEQRSPPVPQEHPPLLWDCAPQSSPIDKPNSTCRVKEHPHQ